MQIRLSQALSSLLAARPFSWAGDNLIVCPSKVKGHVSSSWQDATWEFSCCLLCEGVGGTVACESILRSAGTLLSRVRAPPSAPRPDGGPKSLRLSCCGLAIYKTRLLMNP
ncbi:hypothetical protein PoB_005731400 [Plakobranchus ocellatus]|uniref:Secreted protein n=1 Tax=Plakobranchus ocellatus TaxID=259542 RepID=A0AAV4CIX9_9GAST|nr:hypothetical protein PoB_005731400 [Plakobranchus ocellatus]